MPAVLHFKRNANQLESKVVNKNVTVAMYMSLQCTVVKAALWFWLYKVGPLSIQTL